jgi:hypothetical protein
MDNSMPQATEQKQRRYFTVSLGNPLPEKPFRCHECGYRITTVSNEPMAMVEVKILPTDAQPQKLSEVMCRNCKIIYLFV